MITLLSSRFGRVHRVHRSPASKVTIKVSRRFYLSHRIHLRSRTAMSDVFPRKRTRSQLALRDDILKIPQGSPMKDAKKARTAPRSANNSLDETEDELLLSPRKREGRSKRSVTPEPQDEYSPAFGSPSGRELKRVKRDNLEERKGVDDKMAQYNARNTSETRLSAVKGKSPKRPAALSKKPTSTLSASPPPSVYSPMESPKGRAQSVPLFTTVSLP